MSFFLIQKWFLERMKRANNCSHYTCHSSKRNRCECLTWLGSSYKPPPTQSLAKLILRYNLTSPFPTKDVSVCMCVTVFTKTHTLKKKKAKPKGKENTFYDSLNLSFVIKRTLKGLERWIRGWVLVLTENLCSQHQHGSPQTSLTPVPIRLMSFTELQGHQRYRCTKI